ncbi:MAG: S1 RNA-binding domain-containing protein [Anaerolineales bacterium]|nr:S1 RNA-binding domain-containing protein [Anaerolineales bacterium]
MTDDIDFSEALESYLDQHDYNLPEAGDIRKGVIVSISEDGVIVDLGVKRDGFVSPSDLAKLSEKERKSLTIDQEIPVYIVSTGNPESLHVSIHRALLNEDWIKAQELLENGEITEAEVVGYNRGGALVEFGRLRGFIPLSQLSDFRPGMKDREKQRLLSKLRSESLPLKVIEVDRRRRRLVLSHRDAQREWLASRRGERFEELEAGQVLNGRVSSLRDFGAFVDIGDGVEGLVHVSELAWYRIEHPREVTKVGEEMEVYILNVDAEKQRVSLSRKRLLADPWSQVDEKYEVGQLVEGRVTRLVNYGAFVELEPGIEGLLHSSKLARNDVGDPSEIVREGEKHLLRVISVDSERQRIGLSLKAVTQQEQIDWMMTQTEEEVSEVEAVEDELELDDEDDGEMIMGEVLFSDTDDEDDAPNAEGEDEAEEEAEVAPVESETPAPEVEEAEEAEEAEAESAADDAETDEEKPEED